MNNALPFSLSSPSGNPIRDTLAENFLELLKYTKPQSHSIIHETLFNGYTFYREAIKILINCNHIQYVLWYKTIKLKSIINGN